MFGTHFYHEKTRKCVAAFGRLFNNIYVVRKNSSGGGMSQLKVPLSYAPKQKYLDISPTMLKADGTPKPEIFVSDELHMNQKGYDGWKMVLRPLIEKELVR